MSRSIASALIFLALAGLAACGSSPKSDVSRPGGPRVPASAADMTVLYRADIKPADWPERRSIILIDSRWGKLGALQDRLSLLLSGCGKPGITADGKFGPASFNALAAVAACKGWPAQPDRQITADAWSRAFEGASLNLFDTSIARHPDVADRAFGFVLANEGTDFDRFYWNFGTPDQAGGTWGPFGATINFGNEIRAILTRVQAEKPSLIHQAFGSEAAFIRTKFLPANAEASAMTLARAVFDDPARRTLWIEAFKMLGQDPVVRRIFMAYALESDNWLKLGMRLAYSLIPEGKATEIDYAFFLDLITQTGGYEAKVAASRTGLAAAAATKGAALTPAERREVIGRAFANNLGNPVYKLDRLGRNVAFFIDGIDPSRVPADELLQWSKRNGLRASNYGLSDDRLFRPAGY